jgi:haloacetate dehalogenase
VPWLPRGVGATQTEGMFAGFTEELIDVGGAELFVRYRGQGPAVTLLHGHPRTSSTWHWVAPQLVEAGFTVVCPDLRGYGRSSKPPSTADHSPYSKRAMAGDIANLMTALGHETFSLVGHDRGSYVALRLALDVPDRLRRLVLMDCIPISEHLARITPEFATDWFHWFFFAQPAVPERVINADPEAWYGGSPDAMGAENHAEWLRAIHDPETVHAMLEDYRAGLGVDRADELHDRERGRRITAPLLLLWSGDEKLHADPLAVWSDWATDFTGRSIGRGHHIAEEVPDELARELSRFLRST